MNGYPEHSEFEGLPAAERQVVDLLVRDAALQRPSRAAASRIEVAAEGARKQDPVLASLNQDAGMNAAERAGLVDRVFDTSVAFLPQGCVHDRRSAQPAARHARRAGSRRLRFDVRGWGALAAGIALAFVFGTRFLQPPQQSRPTGFVLHEIIAIGDPTDDDADLEFGIVSPSVVSLGEITYDEVDQELNFIESLLASR